MTSKWASEFRPYGAYVDEIEFVLFTEGKTAQPISALQNGDIDAYDERVLVDYLVPLINNENITVTFTPSVRYNALTLNCERFPTNITAFRRAMAFGFDKIPAIRPIGRITQYQDSYIPAIISEWEVESELNEYFYEADFVSGNRSLENAGFKDLDGDGWREYDKNDNGLWDPGIDFDDNEYADGGVIDLFYIVDYDPAIKAYEIMADGLEKMGIHYGLWDSNFQPSEIYDINPYFDAHVRCWTEGVPLINPPKLMYDNFRTGAIWNKDPNNYYHFSNSTIDAVLDQMVEATTLEDVKKYAREANKLLTFEQPQIVVYNDVNIGAFRTDKFESWFEFAGSGWTSSDNWACATKLHLKEDLRGPWGGTFKYCLSDDIDTLNPYLLKTKYEETVFQYIYERLWNIDPDTWDPIPGLAYDWDIEQTGAGTDGWILDGQKFTFYLYENETWHDGEPFTAVDVNHSIHMWRNSPKHESEMWDIYNVTIPNNYTIELYVNETGYFEWADTTHFYITPEHIWREVTNVSAFVPTDDQIIGTGPYKWNEYVPGESISLLRHEDWRWDIRDAPIPPPSSSEGGVSTQVTTSHQSSLSENTPGFTLVILMVVSLSILTIKRLKTKI